MCKQSRERRGSILTVRRSICLKVIDTDSGSWVHVPARLRPQRLDVAVVALCLSAEQLIASLCGGRIEVFPGLGFWCFQSELVQVQRRQLPRDQVLIGSDVGQIAEMICCRDGKLHWVIQSRVEEPSFP